jgi:hypothetical protein
MHRRPVVLSHISPTGISPGRARSFLRSTDVTAFLHQQLAEQRHREACIEARRARLVRALRAQRRVQRALAVERSAVEELALAGTAGALDG